MRVILGVVNNLKLGLGLDFKNNGIMGNGDAE
jgi:hypothetical protein